MQITKLKIFAAFMIAAGLLVSGGGLVAQRSAAGDRTQAAERPKTTTIINEDPGKDKPRTPRTPAKDANTVTGALQSLDTEKNTITISIFSRKEGESTEKTYQVAKDAKILRDGKEAKLGDLKKVGRIAIKLSEDQSTAIQISTVARTATGEFFDVGKKTITLIMETRQGKEKRTFTLESDVKVTVAGKAATVQELKEGAKVVLTFSAVEENVLQISVATPPGRERKD